MTVPSRLGPLALETKLGDHPSGSQVWRAIHLKQRRPLAVKVFPTPFGVTPEAKASLAQEWAKLQTIDHPAIVKCYGGGFEPGVAYLAYELVEGETLAYMLQRRTRLPWESVLDLADGLLEGLVHIHALGVVHQRLVPSKVIFAGLAPVIVDPRANRYQSTFRSTRPPAEEEMSLVAPELQSDSGASSEAGTSSAADWYSLAGIMYLACTGRSPEMGSQSPPPSSIVSDIPIWIDKFVMPMLSSDPGSRPASGEAVKLQLAETRRRCWDRTSVTEATSRGFSPLDTSNQEQRDEARQLLGRGSISATLQPEDDPHAPWHQSALALFVALMAAVALCAFMLWPLSEDQMRSRAESLLADSTRASYSRAKNRYLEPMLKKFPDGQHSDWAQSQIQRINMAWAESALNTKIKKNLPLSGEGERLYAEANRYERFGDRSTALDRYRSLVTLMQDEPEYLPYVNLARRQIASIESDISESVGGGEASQLVQSKLDQAAKLRRQGDTIAARAMLYSIVELYGGNAEVRSQVEIAQQRLQATSNSATKP